MIKIFSHPRSGTHFLEAFVAKNFYASQDLCIKNIEWGHWGNRKVVDENPYGQLFGGHHLPTRSYRLKLTPIIYIYRDGRAVAYSVWKTPNFLNSEMSKLSFSEFLRTPLDWIGSPGQRSNSKLTIIEHWIKHVEEWRKLKGNILCVSYEELVDNPHRIYKKIVLHCFPYQIWKLLTNSQIEIIHSPLGLLPNKGMKYGWKEIFSDEDLYYFKKTTPSWLLKLYP